MSKSFAYMPVTPRILPKSLFDAGNAPLAMFLKKRHGTYECSRCHSPTIAAPIGEELINLRDFVSLIPLFVNQRVPPTRLKSILRLFSAALYTEMSCELP